MNPEFVAATYIHTVPEKLAEYFIKPFTNIGIILILVIMFANIYMFKKLRKIRRRDYVEVVNLFTIGIYSMFSIISAILVSRLGPHGTLTTDDCDNIYMFIPKTLFLVIAILNIIYFVINIITKLKKDKEYKDAEERGYFAEEKAIEKTEEKQSETHNNIDISSFIDNIKEKIDMDSIKDKVNNITEDIKEMVNSKIKKDE